MEKPSGYHLPSHSFSGDNATGVCKWKVSIRLGYVAAQAVSRRLPNATTRDRGHLGFVVDKAALRQGSS
jgi:hypothetical protein